MSLHPPDLLVLRLATANQFFNTMDPSPFHDRDLDRAAEEFIVSWAREQPSAVPLRLRIILKQPVDVATVKMIEVSVANYFNSRAANTRRELRELLREGRTALLIGMSFLGLMILCRNLLLAPGGWFDLLREGLIISGWVALWKPIDIHLYRWWPVRRLIRLQDRLARCAVEVVTEA